jgi:hypothetical protein
MFLRVVRAAGGNGVKHEYLRLVEAYRDQKGKTQHRTIVNLGRRDVLREHLDVEKLTRLLHGGGALEAKGDEVGAIGAWDWGGMLVAQKMWSDLGLHATLDKASNVERTDGARLSDRVLVLVANRLLAPGSEHALARWLENDFVCDRRGRRFVAAWRKDDVRKASSTPRVRVEMRQLKQWYRTLDELLALKNV